MQRLPRVPHLSSLIEDKAVMACDSEDGYTSIYIWTVE